MKDPARVLAARIEEFERAADPRLVLDDAALDDAEDAMLACDGGPRDAAVWRLAGVLHLARYRLAPRGGRRGGRGRRVLRRRRRTRPRRAAGTAARDARPGLRHRRDLGGAGGAGLPPRGRGRVPARGPAPARHTPPRARHAHGGGV
ncbi:hypothetical protein ACFSTC_18400 [Nonomuraea ferruginea]